MDDAAQYDLTTMIYLSCLRKDYITNKDHDDADIELNNEEEEELVAFDIPNIRLDESKDFRFFNF